MRIDGIDLARGLAVLGMVTAHVAPGGPDSPLPWSLTQVADGRPSALFVVLSGVSVALMSGGVLPRTGVPLVQSRIRILARAFVLLGVGGVLALMNTPVVVILSTYAVLFAVAACVLRTSSTALLVSAAVVALIAPPIRMWLQVSTMAGPGGAGVVDLVIGEHYPALVWIAYLLVGVAVTRADLGARATRLWMLGGGVAAAVLGYGSAAVLTRVIDDPSFIVSQLITSEPHSSSSPEVLGNIGVALVTLACCLWVAERWPRAVAPLTATGALALTAYIGHIVAIRLLGSEVVWEPTATVWLAFLVVIIVGCWAWRTHIGRGPAEWALHRIAYRASDIKVTATPTGDPT
ncbi:DUF418 domain-containing protein [Cellulomonas sp. NPDC089187]|uniref:DUF418 domain-containing protein n=1 Tax=Cellulomonas sp. NPDC089187 TaxID=3154970 RepID=UPI0034376C59